jgi:aminodeoxyfutalosine synthase
LWRSSTAAHAHLAPAGSRRTHGFRHWSLDIVAKLDASERLTLNDGVRLFACPDLHALGWLANREREKRHGGHTFYNYNLRLEATNVCVATCLFCSFSRLKPGDAEAYTLTLEQVLDKLRQRAHQPLTEVHVVNGLHPDLPFSYYPICCAA